MKATVPLVTQTLIPPASYNLINMMPPPLSFVSGWKNMHWKESQQLLNEVQPVLKWMPAL